MTKAQLATLRQAAKLAKELFKPCKEYNWGCWECRSARLAEEFYSFTFDMLEPQYCDDYKEPKKNRKNIKL